MGSERASRWKYWPLRLLRMQTRERGQVEELSGGALQLRGLVLPAQPEPAAVHGVGVQAAGLGAAERGLCKRIVWSRFVKKYGGHNRECQFYSERHNSIWSGLKIEGSQTITPLSIRLFGSWGRTNPIFSCPFSNILMCQIGSMKRSKWIVCNSILMFP